MRVARASDKVNPLGPRADDLQDVLLDAPHDGIGPGGRVEIEVGRNPELAGQIQNHSTTRRGPDQEGRG